MKPKTEPFREGALLIRPRCSRAWTGEEPIRYGGRPRLPADLDWPRSRHGDPDHFIAAVDFARLPRAAEMDGEPFDTPFFPRRGTLFIFLPLWNDGLYGRGGARLRYAAGDVSAVPERAPPEDLVSLREADAAGVASGIDVAGTSPCGRFLLERRADAAPFVSVLPVPADPDDDFDWTDMQVQDANARARFDAFRASGLLNADPTADWPRLKKREAPVEGMPPGAVWDRRLFDAEQRIRRGPKALSGAHQMFGLGDDFHGEVAEHAGDILLFQVGHSGALPLLEDGIVVHLWIAPEALGVGDFSHVEMTLGMD